jgi:hypothetical protein
MSEKKGDLGPFYIFSPIGWPVSLDHKAHRFFIRTSRSHASFYWVLLFKYSLRIRVSS